MTTLAAVRERYLRAQLAGDRREAVRLVVEEGLGACGASFVDVQAGVVAAAQDELGRLWQLDLVSIAQEHMATAISHVALAALFERARPAATNGKKIVLGCVEGELHDLPARLASDLLELDGFELRFLGANVPHDDLVAIVREERPDLVGLSVTLSLHLPSLREAVARLRTVTTAPILVGGNALAWAQGIGRELDVTTAGPASDDVRAAAHRLTGLAGAAS